MSRNNRRKIAIAIVSIVLLIVIFAGLFVASYYKVIALPAFFQNQIDLLPEIDARDGTPSARELDYEIDQESFRIVINQVVTIKKGTSTSEIQVENPDTNHYDFRLIISDKETGEALATTHMIKLGKHLSKIKLNQIMPVGEHELTAKFELYDADKNFVSDVGIPITLRVVE